MSGIVGILNRNGAAIDRTILSRLTNFLAFRGPDAQRMWFRGPLGFGHALLQIDAPSEDGLQPLTLNSNSWIVADARLDGRRDLIAALQPRTAHPLDAASDAQLILLAHQTWGEDCLDHLIGDFSFAIWDSSRRRLFCARDQLGVKPFFYAHLGPLLIFSNTLDCLRRHPAVSDRLNDLSIADFLLFDMIQDLSATAFADIQRLPPAHALVCDLQTVSVRRYWQPSAAAPVHYPRPADYVERFQELLDDAVTDRLRSESACIFMSGGLDSPTVAASAARVNSRNGGAARLWAFTQVFDSLIPHDERHYAGLVARALDIPIEYRPDDGLRPFQFAGDAEHHFPEPGHCAWPDASRDHLRRVATESRVVLTGFGADPLFSSRITVHFRELLSHLRLGRAFTDAARYFLAEGRLSRLYLRTRWRILRTAGQHRPHAFPPWLNEDFAARLHLQGRWHTQTRTQAPPGAVRPEACEVTFGPFWPEIFNALDPGVTRVPVQVCHPFFDLRLMNFLLGLPRLPWCCDKQLLRESARGVLPDAIRLRRKSPLRADPLLKLLQRADADSINRFQPAPELERFVVRSRIPRVTGQEGSWEAWVNLRPLSLNYWLERHYRAPEEGQNSVEENSLACKSF